jgi:two-component system sensor histidine kinase UhpB
MFQRLSLRAKLLALLGATLAFGLATGVGLLILHAKTRVRAEADGAARLASEFVATALASVEESGDPIAALRTLLAGVERLRHIRIYMDGTQSAQASATNGRGAPDWFVALVVAHPSVTRVNLEGRGRLHGDLVIAAEPGDEIAEIWNEVVFLAFGGAALAFAGFVMVSIVVSRALRPISTIADGLKRLERGDRSVRIDAAGARELLVIADRIDALAATLARLDAENRRLLERLVHVQDEERRDIARDLHDEIGPFLFTVRAGLGALARRLEDSGVDARLVAECARIDDQLGALQQVNRRILGRLRPAALEEMGLEGALQALVSGWREAQSDVEIDLNVAEEARLLDESSALTVYRIVQEGLTNVFRHSGAERVEIDVGPVGEGGRREMRIAVKDDGAGLFDDAKQGIGLRSMGERVAALGGWVRLESVTPRGALLEARLPLNRA